MQQLPVLSGWISLEKSLWTVSLDPLSFPAACLLPPQSTPDWLPLLIFLESNDSGARSVTNRRERNLSAFLSLPWGIAQSWVEDCSAQNMTQEWQDRASRSNIPSCLSDETGVRKSVHIPSIWMAGTDEKPVVEDFPFFFQSLVSHSPPRHLSLPQHSVLALKSDNTRKFHVVKMSFYAQEKIFRSYFIHTHTHTLNLLNLIKPNFSLGFNVPLTSVIILYIILATLWSTFRKLWLNLNPFTKLFEH